MNRFKDTFYRDAGWFRGADDGPRAPFLLIELVENKIYDTCFGVGVGLIMDHDRYEPL
jgi:hypothetical protein